MDKKKNSPKSRLVSRSVLVVALAVLLVALGAFGLFNRFNNHLSVANGPSQLEGAALAQHVVAYTATLEHPNDIFTITVNDKKVVAGPSFIRVNKGDAVLINIRPDKGEVKASLDGYDINTESNTTSAPGSFRFIADKTGKFSIKLTAWEAEADGGQNEDFNPPRVVGTVEVK